jgi:hypothetical protein
MESYGIGRTTKVLHVDERVVILRIVTDALANKDTLSSSYQEDTLKRGRIVLASVLLAMVGAAGGN